MCQIGTFIERYLSVAPSLRYYRQFRPHYRAALYCTGDDNLTSNFDINGSYGTKKNWTKTSDHLH